MVHKLNMMLLLMIFLISCAKIPNQYVCDISFVIDIEKDRYPRCRCRWISSKTFKSITDPESFPVEKCEGITGVSAEKLASELIPHVKDAIRECEDLQDF